MGAIFGGAPKMSAPPPPPPPPPPPAPAPAAATVAQGPTVLTEAGTKGRGKEAARRGLASIKQESNGLGKPTLLG